MPPEGYTARRLLALASGEPGRADEAAAALLASREELGDWPLEGGLDPLAADFDRSLAELALLRGEAAVAASALRRLADAEAETMGEGGATGEGGPPLPAHGWTLVLLGRAATRLGDTKRAAAVADARLPVGLSRFADVARAMSCCLTVPGLASCG